MIKFVGRWLGITGFAQNEMDKLKAPAEAAVLNAALIYESAVKRKLTGPRSGRLYGSHQASAPGEPPALWSGELRRSISHTMPIWDNDGRVFANVGTRLVYAAILEWGGYAGNGARILPRPYMESTFIEQRSRLERALAVAVDNKQGKTFSDGGDT